MVASPVPYPVTIPVAEPTETMVEPLYQVPPVVASVKVIAEPSHTLEYPVIVPAPVVTVTVWYAPQPPTA